MSMHDKRDHKVRSSLDSRKSSQHSNPEKSVSFYKKIKKSRLGSAMKNNEDY
jgi:hypothetical protein